MAVLTAVFLLLGILFFFASIALLFRLRFSGWVYSALCVAYLLWWSTGTIACLVSYNGIISRLLSGAFFQTAPGGEADVEQVISRGYALSFAVGEVLSLVFAIAFFGGMLYLVNRREVREELRRRPPGDAEQWEAL
jgi:beta-lactamase regulating signal transducer with metallopeptidase domain